MKYYNDDINVEGLLFNYQHFYGSYDFVGDSTKWYRREVRIIRPNSEIVSFGDAQGFRKTDGKKINVKPINAKIYHYGWVKHPKVQEEKLNSFRQLWQEDEPVEMQNTEIEFDYSNISALKKFTGTHPQVMLDRIARKNWDFKFDESKIKISSIEKLRRIIENHTGWRIGEYKDFRVI